MSRKANIVRLSDEELSIIREIRAGADYHQLYGVREAIELFCIQGNNRFKYIKNWRPETKQTQLKHYHHEFKLSLRVMGGYGKWYRKTFLEVNNE